MSKLGDKTDKRETPASQSQQMQNSKMALTASRGAEFERIRQNLIKRSFDVKFELRDTDYKPIENIGIGAYGVVCSAINSKTNGRVAIKKIHSVFDAVTIAKRTYREIKILKHFKHDNIICIKEILMPKESLKDFKDIYVVFDLMESDLHRIIYSDQALSEEHIRYFLYQTLRGLKYIHSANVVHRDLKPSNLLVNEDCHLRIGDFGMARGVFQTPDEPSYFMTQYVATRWYRAPEILLSMLEYGPALDIWSVGCIFAEMMGRKHLFPGKDYISQVKLILGILGTPSEDLMKNCQIDLLRKMIKSLGKKDPVSWSKLFPKTSKKSIDLLGKMLVLKPSDRVNVEQALAHRLFNHYHDPDDEPVCVPPFHFDFEKTDMDKKTLRAVIVEEILDFHKPKVPTLSFSACLRPAPRWQGDTAKKESKEVPTEASILNSQGSSISHTTKEGKAIEVQEPLQSATVQTGSTKTSPVFVKTSQLSLAPPCSDIEMLSAQSSDGHVMDTQPSEVEVVKIMATLAVNKGKEPLTVADRKEKNTISEDTKALVKQALMNAVQRRQRTESQSEEVDKSKPITAAQRQKEREEKRRKKKERALEKVKKTKCKKIPEKQFLLTNEDKELLRRWAVMQAPGQPQQQGNNNSSPPHSDASFTQPTNTTATITTNSNNSSSSSSSLSGQTSRVQTSTLKPRQILAKSAASSSLGQSLLSTGQTTHALIIPSSQLCLSQANFVPVIAIPSIVNPGKVEIKRILPPPQSSQLPQQTQSSQPRQAIPSSDSTKSLLQNSILLRQQQRDVVPSSAPQTLNMLASNVAPGASGSPAPSIQYHKSSDPTSFGTLAEGSGVAQSEIKTEENDSNPVPANSFMNQPSLIQPSDILGELQMSSQDKDNSVHTSSHSPHSNFASHSNPEQIQNQQNVTIPTPVQPEATLHSNMHDDFNNGHNLVMEPFRNQTGFSLNYQTSDNLQSEGRNEAGNFVPNFHGPDDLNSLFRQDSDSDFNAHLSPDSLFKNSQSPPNFTTQTEFQQPNHQAQANLFSGGANMDAGLHSFDSSGLPYLGHSEQQQHFRNQYPSFPSTHDNHGQGQGFPTERTQQGRMMGSSFASSATNMGTASTSGNQNPSIRMDTSQSSSGPRLTVDTSKASTSRASNQPPTDLIALLSKQLSKSQVADIFPPSLTLTPKGTGAGYGVGIDLESMMTDAQDSFTSNRVEQSPLSSSLLADWLDLSENFSQADIEALEREFALQSPMHITFHDDVGL